MSDTKSGSLARARKRRPPGRRVAFPETLTIGLSAGWLARLTTAAEGLGMNRAEFVRRCLRRGLDAARKKQAGGR